MNNRLRSGHAPLDAVLGGGLPANAISLIMGRPGSGKTIVAQQYLFSNGTRDRPAVFFSTVSEPLEKIIRFGQSLEFFNAAEVGRSVFYEDLGSTVALEGLPGVVEQVSAVLKERRPRLIVIDSFKALHAFAGDQGEFRRFLHTLAGRLTAFPVGSLWVGEYEDAEIGSMAEFAVADAILDLTVPRTAEREMRFLRVRKLRGSGFRSGMHAYRIGAGGVQLFPRLADAPIGTEYSLVEQRSSTGIAALDGMLEHGYWQGSSTLIAGPSGSGKTLMGLHFIFNGARRGEPGVIASLQENTTQLERVVRGFGWSLHEPNVETMYRSPVDVYIDEWVHDLLTTVERIGARRVLVDSLHELRLAAAEEIRFREFVYSLAQRFSRQGVSVMMTMETPDLFDPRRLSDAAVSAMSDNVVLLRYVRRGSTLLRAMAVIKTRASRHDPSVREFFIGTDGIQLGAALTEEGAVMPRSDVPLPTRQVWEDP